MEPSRITTTAAALIALAVATFSLLPSAGAVAVPRSIVASAYSYHLGWNPRTRNLVGTGTIKVENRRSDPQRDVWIRLRANRGDRLARALPLDGARIMRSAALGSMVLVRLPEPVAAGASANLRFKLKLRVPRARTSLGRSAGIDLFGDALPVVAADLGSGPRIGPEPNYGEGSANPMADWWVRIRVPDGVRALLPGSEKRRRVGGGVYYESAVRARDYAFAVGRYERRTAKVNDVRVTVVGSHDLAGQLPAALRRARSAFRYMQTRFGGYPYRDFKVVVGDLDFGGSEYPGLVFSTPDRGTIAHEVAHQWFYALVGNDQYADPFLDESLTAFVEEQLAGSYRCTARSPLVGSAHGLGSGMSFWGSRPERYVATIYQAGACALTRLRAELGATAFESALRSYVLANAGQLAQVRDFLDAVQRAAPWYDVNQWALTVGLNLEP